MNDTYATDDELLELLDTFVIIDDTPNPYDQSTWEDQ